MSRSSEFLKMVEEVELDNAISMCQEMIKATQNCEDMAAKLSAAIAYLDDHADDKETILNALDTMEDKPFSRLDLYPAPVVADPASVEVVAPVAPAAPVESEDDADEEGMEEAAKELDKDIENDKLPFIQIMDKVKTLIDRKALNTRGDIYKLLLDKLVKQVEGPAMVNRKLTIGLRQFWKELQSGQYKKDLSN